jgi:DNA polymerase III epsilon subunit-like protein
MKIAILDLETTGFSSSLDCIVEMGMVELDLKTGDRKPLYNKIIKEPHYSESHKKSWIYTGSSLTHEEVMAADPLDKDTIQDLFTKYRATAFNKSFDMRFLKERGFIVDELPCPMRVATPILKLPKKRGNGYKNPNVTEAYKMLVGNKEYIEEHRGFQDAMDEAEIVYELYKMGHFKI